MSDTPAPGPVVSNAAAFDRCRPGSDAVRPGFAAAFMPGLSDLLVAGGVAALAALGMLVLSPGNATDPVIWPANALPIAYLLARPRRPEWHIGITVVVLAAFGTLLGTLAAGLAFGSAAVTSLMAAANIAISAWAGRRLPGPRPGITRAPAILKLGVSAALAGPAAGALVAFLAMHLTGIASPVSFVTTMLGALLYVPACIALAGGRRRLRRASSPVALGLVLLALGVASAQPMPGGLVAIILLLTMFAFLAGALPATFPLAAVGVILTVLTLHGLGTLITLSADPAHRLILLQRFLAGCAISTLAAALIAEWRGSQLARLRLEQARLRRREARYRTLATMSADVILVCRPGGQITYVSPAVQRLLGVPGPALIGRNAFDFLHPDDADRVIAEFGAIGNAVRDVTVETRLRPAGFGPSRAPPVWVEIRTRLSEESGAGSVELVSAIRDVSVRRARDERRSADLARLARLANTDPLTGLANRRRFMEHLELEWRRALREQTELALMLVDIDRFKSFNDHYGHPAGDAALQGATAIIAATALRPADLAARIGGEEFAVILPNTFLSGARTLAERIRAGLRVAAIPHIHSPSGLITVSIGICCLRPSPYERHQSLIDQADRALYAAKTQRDCVKIAP